jgi:flagellar assembly protein FliH
MGAAFVSLLSPPKPLPPPPAPAPPPPPPVDVEAVRAVAREEGRRLALAELQAELADARAGRAVVPELVEALEGARKQALDRAAQDVVLILSAGLRKVLGDHLVHRPEVLLSIVVDAMARLEGEEGVVIRAPTAAVEFLKAGLPERHQGCVRADAGLAAGVVVEATHATIEASLETMVAGFDEAMRAWLEGR